jgi:hypothetical protein
LEIYLLYVYIYVKNPSFQREIFIHPTSANRHTIPIIIRKYDLVVQINKTKNATL